MSEGTLPAEFRALEPYAATWALATQGARERQRRASTPEELQRFYEAMAEAAERAIEHLNGFSLADMPAAERNLLYLTLSLAEVAPHVELYRGDPRVPFSFEEERFIADHGQMPHFMGNLYSGQG